MRKLKNILNDKVINPKNVKSKAATLLMLLAKASCPNEARKGDGVKHGGKEKENQVPPMLLVGLFPTASKTKKNERTFVDTRPDMEVINQCVPADWKIINRLVRTW